MMLTRTWQSPDPRKVWKIEAQLGETSNFEATNIFTIRIPLWQFSIIETNLGGYPFRITFQGRNWVSTELLLTNRTDLRLNYLQATDEYGQPIYRSGWTQFIFQILIDRRT